MEVKMNSNGPLKEELFCSPEGSTNPTYLKKNLKRLITEDLNVRNGEMKFLFRTSDPPSPNSKICSLEMSCIEELAKAAKSNKIEDEMLVLLGRQVETELKLEEKF
ncbi:hypothetical protein Tco_0673913 [Tanacetum coccineum]